jgi:ADP-ribose pyrophosphatase YjhB (NUDIX family)
MIEIPSLHDDLRTEGAPEEEFHPGIAASLPHKRVAAAALIRDHNDRLLLLEPTYKPTWVLPGGVVEENEDPMAGCIRELKEELGIDHTPGRLLVVDWVPQHGVWGDSLQFVFDGGRVTPEQISGFALQAAEIRAVHFIDAADLAAQDEGPRSELKLTPSMSRRLSAAVNALEKGTPEYLRYGRIVGAVG